MAEQILFNFAEEILRVLGSEVLQQFGLAWGATKQLKKLETTMSTVKSVLLDAQEQQVRNSAVRDWLQRLKDIVYDVDDLLDEFATYALRRKVEDDGSMIKEVFYFFTPSNPLIFRYNVGRKIKSLMERLDEIVADMKNFEFIVKYVDRQIKVRRREETCSSVRNSEVIGRENDKEAIIKLLKCTDVAENVAIFPIVGLGGLGKTTLAQLVYNDKKVKDQFDLRLWVCVSDDFDIKRIIAKLLRVAGDRDSSLENLEIELLQTRLEQKLSDRKFFLVLDDVWNEDLVEWINLRDLLMVGARGCRIVVTTRSKTVASIMGTLPSYDLKGLSDNDCLSVLVKWAFREGDYEKHSDLVNIGREIVKKCGGVPLAVRTLGGLLFSKTDERDWLSVQYREMGKLVQKENDILRILRLSYDQMPSHLKQCFAYCSILKKGDSIRKWKLIYLWMAQGFIDSSEQELEDTGECYFNELLVRSFLLQEDDKVLAHEDDKVTYKMHDIVRVLAESVAGSECISVSSCTTTIPDGVRHVSFIPPSQFPESLLKVKKLRTIFSPKTIIPRISTFRYLRVLEFNNLFSEVPSSITQDLVHLRFLTLYVSYTNFIVRLLNLQYLKIQNSDLRELSEDFGKLINLRYLHFSMSQTLTSLPEKGISGLTSLRMFVIFGCRDLTNLPEGIQHLTKLRKLEIIRCPQLVSLPSGMRYLTALEKLTIKYCESLKFSDDDFQGLRSLEFLTLHGLPNLVSLPSGMTYLTALRSLSIHGCPHVRRRCRREVGEDWSKIAHVPQLDIE